jgi:hypothetical protein
MADFRYSTPALQNDLAGQPQEAAYLDGWSTLIARRFQAEIANLRRILQQEPLFFSELEHTIPANTVTAPVPWVGFPRVLSVLAGGDRRAALDAAERRDSQRIGFEDEALTLPITCEFRQQDEYLEWVPIKKAGVITRFAFTAEGPEYWEYLASVDKDAVLRLYREFTAREVAWSELAWPTDVWVPDPQGQAVQIYAQGDYNPYNKVNLEECAAHLTHPANTLGAEIDLAAKATVLRLDANDELVSERRRLACCSNFGDQNRNSDPTIGLAVNQTVRGGVSLTLADPVGLYIRAFDASRIADSAGNALDGWWSARRGTQGRVLRAELGPPAGCPLTIADVRVGNNEPLHCGGQLAELITMVLYARAVTLGVPEPAAQHCANRCCVKKGSSPESSVLYQVPHNSKLPPGLVNAFPELAPPPMNPFTRRSMGRGMRDPSGGPHGPERPVAPGAPDMPGGPTSPMRPERIP